MYIELNSIYKFYEDFYGTGFDFFFCFLSSLLIKLPQTSLNARKLPTTAIHWNLISVIRKTTAFLFPQSEKKTISPQILEKHFIQIHIL